MTESVLARVFSLLATPTLRIRALQAAELLRLRNLLVRMDTNNLCNLRCEMCPEVELRRRKDFRARFMSLDEFGRVAREVFPRAQVLYLSCSAEPLITPGFDRYLEVAASHGVPFVSFVTNAMLLTREVVDRCVERRIAQISVSADGARAATYEAIRTRARFDRLLDGLSLIRERKRALRSDLPRVRLNFTVSRLNHGEILDFLDLAHAHGASSVQFRPLTPFDTRAASLAQQLSPHDEASVALQLAEARRRARQMGIELLGHGEFTGKELRQAGSLVDRCAYPWYYRFIEPNGDLRLCPSRPPVGNLLTQSYRDIMRSPAARQQKADVRARAERCRAVCGRGPGTQGVAT